MVLLGSNWPNEKSELNHFYSKELRSLIVISNDGRTIFSYKSGGKDLPFKEKPKRYNLGSECVIRTYPHQNLVKLASGDLFEISALLSNGEPFVSEIDDEVDDIVSELSLKPNVLPNRVLDDKFFLYAQRNLLKVLDINCMQTEEYTIKDLDQIYCFKETAVIVTNTNSSSKVFVATTSAQDTSLISKILALRHINEPDFIKNMETTSDLRTFLLTQQSDLHLENLKSELSNIDATKLFVHLGRFFDELRNTNFIADEAYFECLVFWINTFLDMKFTDLLLEDREELKSKLMLLKSVISKHKSNLETLTNTGKLLEPIISHHEKPQKNKRIPEPWDSYPVQFIRLPKKAKVNET